MDTETRIKQIFMDSAQLKSECADLLPPLIETAVNKITGCLFANGKILTCGNGGSAADAQHFAAEMLNRFEIERPGLPTIALTTDSSTLTSIANDYRFSEVFARQVRALGQPGDILLVVTTSGNSENLLTAITTAQKRDLGVILLSGRDGGEASKLINDGDLEIRVPSNSTPRIQEVHITILHCICDQVDRQLLGLKHD